MYTGTALYCTNMHNMADTIQTYTNRYVGKQGERGETKISAGQTKL